MKPKESNPNTTKMNQNLFLLSLLFSSLLVLATANPGAFYPHDAPKVVAADAAVEGVVYCQSCAHAGTWSLADAKPLPAAKVGVSCKDHKNRVKYYKTVQANSHGYFYAPLKQELESNKKYFMDHPIHACAVHLLSSPNPHCNLLTNINSGLEGSPLRNENKTISHKGYKKVEIYAAGPLAFRPAYCPPVVHY